MLFPLGNLGWTPAKTHEKQPIPPPESVSSHYPSISMRERNAACFHRKHEAHSLCEWRRYFRILGNLFLKLAKKVMTAPSEGERRLSAFCPRISPCTNRSTRSTSRHVALIGSVGTGKTTLVQSFLREHGSDSLLSSTINTSYNTDAAAMQRQLEQPLDKVRSKSEAIGTCRSKGFSGSLSIDQPMKSTLTRLGTMYQFFFKQRSTCAVLSLTREE